MRGQTTIDVLFPQCRVYYDDGYCNPEDRMGYIVG